MRERRNIPDALGPSPVSSNQISLIPYLPYLPPLTYTYLFLFLCRATLHTYINSEMKIFWSRPSSFLYSFSSLSHSLLSMFPVNQLICQSIIHYTSLSLSHCFLCLLVLTFLQYFYLSHFLSLVLILITYSLTHWPLVHNNWKYPRYMPNTKKKLFRSDRVWVRVQGHREINSYFILHLMKKVQFNNLIQWKKRRKKNKFLSFSESYHLSQIFRKLFSGSFHLAWFH